MRSIERRIVRVASALLLLTQPALAQFTQNGPKLVGSGAIGHSLQGNSVALSADRKTAIVGGPGDSNTRGAAWVWTRSGGVWSKQAKLVGSGASSGDNQGYSVALSADGNTAIVGGPQNNGQVGAAWVFVRIGGVFWSEQAKLVANDATGAAAQGQSVALSA